MGGRSLSLVPSLQDVAAVGVLGCAYLLRMGFAGDPGQTAPALLTLVTDFVLPVVAASWIWVAAMFVLIERVSEK